jgi:hypothetical protein
MRVLTSPITLFMNKIAYFVLALAGLAFVAQGQYANVGPGSVKLGRVTPNLVKTPEYQITGGQAKRYKLGDWIECEVPYETKAELIDELTFRYTILFAGKLLIGEVTYVNILKEREHYAVMYLSPKTLMRLTGGKAYTASNIENVWVEVFRQGQRLDGQSAKPGAIPNLQQLPGMVLSKTETPFAPLYYDRYEAIKANR